MLEAEQGFVQREEEVRARLVASKEELIKAAEAELGEEAVVAAEAALDDEFAAREEALEGKVGTTKGELGTLSAVSRALGQLKEEVAQKRSFEVKEG